jgi:diacylglycerol O-acyltransferase
VTTVLFDTEREPTTPPNLNASWLAAPERSGLELLAETVVDRLTNPREILEGVNELIRAPREIAGRVTEGISAIGAMVGAGLGAPASPLNVDIGPYRRFATVRDELGRFKRIKNELGGTVNDVVLAVVTGALGRYLRARGDSTAELELRAMVPISVRGSDEHGALGNRVSAMMAPLPVWCEDPVERLGLMSERMGDLKSSKQAVGATLLTELTDFAPPTIVGQAARLQSRQRFFNLVVTNVPGPQFPLYVLGREMEAVIPMVPLAKKQAVCVGIMSYNGQINFGLIGDFDAMTDLDQLAADLRASIEELAEAAGAGASKRDGVGTAKRPKSVAQAQN